AVGKVLLLWIAAHVLERQYRDRRLVRKCKSWRSSLTRLTPLAFGTLSRIAGEGGPRRACDGVGEGCAHAVDPHRPCDVLDLPLAQILKEEGHPVAHMVVDDIGDEHPADIGQRFDSRGNVDAVAIE